VEKGLKVVGRRLPLAESYDKVTGKAEYCSTLQLPGMLVGKVLRSPHAHAKVLKVDASRAAALPGVKTVVTRDDVPRKLFTWNVMTYQLPGGEINDMLLFDDKMRYKGDAVAAVAAVDEPTANAALALIDVEYDVLPAVFTVDEATAEGAPAIHEFAPDNQPVPVVPVFCYGEADQAFDEAHAIVEGEYTTSKQVQAGLENACSVADYRGGRLTVWSQSQLPHMAKRMLAHVLDLPESRVRLVQPYAGCGFGAGTDMHGEPICAALAIKAGAPVKLLYTRSEDFNNRVTREHVAKISMKLGVGKYGAPKALQARYTGDAGAYMCKTASGCGVALASNITEYEWEAMHQEITAIYTNHIGGGAMRGFGGPQSSFARETLVDQVCEQIGMDPVEFRIKAHRKAGGLGWFPGTQISSCGVDECLRIGAERIGWAEKRGKKIQNGTKVRGVGTAIMAWLSGAQPMLLEHSNATLKFNADGGATLVVSPGMMGQGILGTLAQMAAEVLGLPYEDINVVAGDTDVTGFDIGTHASRGIFCIGKAVVAAAEKAKAQFLARAAEKLGESIDDLEMCDRQVRSTIHPDKQIMLADLALDMIYNLDKDCVQVVAHETVDPTDFAPPWQAGFAEVEVDTETGVVDVVKWITVHDIGQAINPTVVEGQLEGSTAQGLGFALWEDPVVSPVDGTMMTDSFERYRLPASVDMPEHEAILVELGDPAGPFGAKSVGESGMFLQAPAVANAVYDAVGVLVRDLPITPERVLAAIQAKQGVMVGV
jgi:xanthine dehydrogenase molybdenum-binding subunit